MTRNIHCLPCLAVAFVVGVVGASCKKETASTSAGAADSGAQPASEAVKPGSHEDWCAEHQVPESMCTRCNPTLIAAFKATGDWCNEHGLPESVCPICKPAQDGRPSVDVGEDGAPADGTKVRFKTKETARLAGIHVARAVERPSMSHVVVTARIVYDATKVAEVNARSSGVVRAIHADVGAKVRPGSPLATIESAGVGADQSRLQAARSHVQVAEAAHARLKRLHDEGIAAEKDAMAARQELDAARAEFSTAQSALGVVGSVAEGASRYTLTTPLAGVVTQRGATIGRLVDTEKVLFEIVDTSSMYAEVDIPETEVGRVAIGQSVSVVVEGLTEKEFSGALSYVSPQIDAHTRTAKGRVALDNPDGLLRGNMFARARISVGAASTAVVVPRQAVQRAKSAQFVFVRLADDVFEARRVQLGASDAELIEVAGRLKAGEEVATEGSFLLKTETLKGSIGAGCCEVEEQR